MSSSIWTQCAGESRLRRLRLDAWRVVEAQHQVSTRKLVDSDAEQQLLEELIDSAKPPYTAPAGLHYLLSTPFRYPPLRYGSRFGTRAEPSLWYGSDALPTALAEVAYYRLVFIEGSAADFGLLETQLTAYSVPIATARAVDLSTSPFDAFHAAISSPASYVETQVLGSAMRAAGVEAFRWVSARCPRGGGNVGVFTPDAFGSKRPGRLETWHCAASRTRVDFVRRDYFDRAAFSFGREEFLVNGLLPAPAFG